MKPRGMSLLEIVIASAILIVVLGTMYLVLFATTSLSEKELALRDAEFQLQVRMDQMAKELRESSQPLIRVYAFTDPAMPTTAQTLVAMPSAPNRASGGETR